MGRHDEALKQYEAAIRVDSNPPNKGQNAWKGYLKIAEMLTSLSDLAQALKAYDMAHSLAPKEVPTLIPAVVGWPTLPRLPPNFL